MNLLCHNSQFMLIGGIILLVVAVVYLFVLKLYLQLFRYRKMDPTVASFISPLSGIIGQQRNSFLKFRDSNMYIKKHIIQNPETQAMLTNIGTSPFLILTSAQLAKQFIQKSSHFQKLKILKFGDQSYFKSIFFEEGSTWKKMREITQRYFNFNNFNYMVPTIHKIADSFVRDQLRKQKFNILTDPQLMLGAVMVKLFFDPQVSNKRSYQISQIFAQFTNAVFVSSRNPINQLAYLFAGDRALNWGITEQDKKLRTLLQRIRSFILEMIQYKIKKIKEGNKFQDFLGIYVHQYLENEALYARLKEQGQSTSTLHRITIEELIHQVASIYFAGIDTTGHLIAFAIYTLAQYPQYLQEIQKQISEVVADKDNISFQCLRKLNKLECVLNQCLRIWPPAIGVLARKVKSPVQVGPFSFKTGDYVGLSMLAIMSNPNHFPDPLKFDPWRWQNQSLNHAFAFIPFSAGKKNCVGQHLAKLQAKLFIISILEHYRLQRTKIPLETTIYFLYQPANQDLVRLRAK